MAETKRTRRTAAKRASSTATNVIGTVDADTFEMNAPEVEETPAEEKVVATEEVTAPVKFEDSDLIPCMSLTAGSLVMVGLRTHEVYVWDDLGEIRDVSYGDLLAATRKNSPFVFAPRFIIKDDDFLAQNKKIEEAYGNMYTEEDIINVLSFPPAKLKKALAQMPPGAQEALTSLATAKIASGEFDSSQRIKVIDEFFGTNLLVNLVK